MSHLRVFWATQAFTIPWIICWLLGVLYWQRILQLARPCFFVFDCATSLVKTYSHQETSWMGSSCTDTGSTDWNLFCVGHFSTCVTFCFPPKMQYSCTRTKMRISSNCTPTFLLRRTNTLCMLIYLLCWGYEHWFIALDLWVKLPQVICLLRSGLPTLQRKKHVVEVRQ
jgi:hypothetical protein